MTNFKDRMLRAAKLDVDLYEEVEADKSAMPQAMGVVVLSYGWWRATGLIVCSHKAVKQS